MKQPGLLRRIALVCALSLALASTSCRLFQAPSYNGPDSLPGAGAVLVAHRGRLYSIGGMSSDGQYSDRVRMATIGEDGGLSAWIDTTERPSPRTLYHTLGQDEALALAVDAAVQNKLMDGFGDNPVKLRNVEFAIRDVFCAWMVKEPEHLNLPFRIPSDCPNPCLKS